jgi:hypothetical protein
LDANADGFIRDNSATAGMVEGLILNATETELGVDINNDDIIGDNPTTQDVNENILKLITETEYGVDLNKDGRVGDDPLTQDVNEDIINGISETGVPWCYAYGEKDWMKPKTISEPGIPTRDAVRDDYKEDAEDDINLRLECK